MRGNSNLNASGIYWLYINPWICSCRNRTSTTAFLLFNRKSNQNKNYTPVLFGMALMTETRRRTMLERSLNYAYAGAEVCAPTLCWNETQACATCPLQGLVSPEGMWAGQKPWHILKKCLICTFNGIRSLSIPHTTLRVNVNTDQEIKVFLLAKQKDFWVTL